MTDLVPRQVDAFCGLCIGREGGIIFTKYVYFFYAEGLSSFNVLLCLELVKKFVVCGMVGGM